jgi:hypothetical protein
MAGLGTVVEMPDNPGGSLQFQASQGCRYRLDNFVAVFLCMTCLGGVIICYESHADMSGAALLLMLAVSNAAALPNRNLVEILCH